MKITARFKSPESFSLQPEYEGGGSSIPAHLAVFGHVLVNLKLETIAMYQSTGDSQGCFAQAIFPGDGVAGMKWEWSGLAHPEEQLPMLGRFFLMLANHLWVSNIEVRIAPHLLHPGTNFPNRGIGR